MCGGWVGRQLRDIDKGVRDNVPGGWVGVGALALGATGIGLAASGGLATLGGATVGEAALTTGSGLALGGGEAALATGGAMATGGAAAGGAAALAGGGTAAAAAGGWTTAQMLAAGGLGLAAVNTVGGMLTKAPSFNMPEIGGVGANGYTPGLNDATTSLSADAAAQSMQRRANRGRSSTMLTGGQGSGVGATTSNALLGS